VLIEEVIEEAKRCTNRDKNRKTTMLIILKERKCTLQSHSSISRFQRGLKLLQAVITLIIGLELMAVVDEAKIDPESNSNMPAKTQTSKEAAITKGKMRKTKILI